MTPPFARSFIDREEVDSTSDLARTLLGEGPADLPMVVRSARQARGRGRGDHTWWSDQGSLTFTIALDPAAHGLRTGHEPRLALATAVALIDAIEEMVPGAPLGIRWPNDVEAGGRKLAGLLPERVETPEGPRLLIGIGVNVRTRLDHAPAEIRAMAASAESLRGRPISPEDAESLFLAMLARFGDVLPPLAAEGPGLAARWDALDTLRGSAVRVDQGARVVSGIGRGINPQGALLLDCDGRPSAIFGGQVLR